MSGFSNVMINLVMTAGVALIAAIASFAPNVVLPSVAMLPVLVLIFALWQVAVERPGVQQTQA